MLRIIWVVSIHLRNFMRRYMPTNILLDAIRTRRGLKWGVPAMLVAIPYLLAASICTALIDGGASRWLYAVALVCIWNALKFIVIGPVSAVRLFQCKLSERSSMRGRLRPSTAEPLYTPRRSAPAHDAGHRRFALSPRLPERCRWTNVE